jgi:hypothetical protein
MSAPHTIAARGAESDLLTIKDPGASGDIICGTRSVTYISLVTAAAEARTLKDPSYAGQTLTLCLKTDSGDCTVTADSAINQAGKTIMTFGDAGDTVALVGVENGSGKEWRVTANDTVTLS